MNTAETITRLMIELIQNEGLNLKKDINSFIGEHIPPDLQGEERASARVNLGDALQSWFEEKVPDSQKISTSFLKEVVDYIDWIAIAQAIDFGHWMNEITEDVEYEGFTNSLTFTVWHWFECGDESLSARRFSRITCVPDPKEKAAEALKRYFSARVVPFFTTSYMFSQLAKAGIDCVNWLEIVQAIKSSSSDR